MLRMIAGLSAACLIAMILIDKALGPRAEFLNAWSVVERLLGRAPSAGDSSIARHFGAMGELLIVLLANAAVGAVLAVLIQSVSKLFR